MLHALRLGPFVPALAALAFSAVSQAETPHICGWLNWRGPEQNGSTTQTGLPSTQAAFDTPLWTYELHGRGTPVIANGRLFAMGWKGTGPDLQEMLVALDAETGALVWEHGENDFLSDTVYDRYAIGAPVVDAETGNVYAMTANGVFSAFSFNGDLLWQHSMMEEFGRLTFPNSRNGAPVVDGDLVIVRGITSNWGGQGPPRDRFYAFDKRTGQSVWASTPGEQPKDNSFSTPVLGWYEGKRVMWVGLGDGNIAAINERTGQPLWRYPISAGGVNSSVIVDGDRLFAVHYEENRDATNKGRMVALDLTKTKGLKSPAPGEPAVVDKSVEIWRNDQIATLSSSPVIDGERVFVVTQKGELADLEAATGNVLWKLKLGRDQIHASPLFADGRLYVPMNDGTFHVVVPSDAEGQEVVRVQLEGNALGAPAVWNEKIYLHTTGKLYAFGAHAGAESPAANLSCTNPGSPGAQPPAGPAVSLQARPAELVLKPGDHVDVQVHKLDAAGFDAGAATAVAWQKFVPPGAKVVSYLDADFDPRTPGILVVGPKAKSSAGAFKASAGSVPLLTGTIRGRLVAGLPVSEDFESYPLSEDHPTEKGVKFGWPPLAWIGGRFAWEVRQDPTNPANKVLAKTIDSANRQRAQTFFGTPDMHDYTVAADVMSDGSVTGSRQLMSDVGIINQRYAIALKGNAQQLEVWSNFERVRVDVPFKWSPKSWYRLTARVDVAPDGKTVVRAKAWKRGEPEPAAWTVEVPHANGHRHGSPGLFGLVPDTQFRVYIDNVSVTPNAAGNTGEVHDANAK
jgi:outer membrane protein assembly factor BamB